MSTDDTGSWAQPNPTDRTDPDFVDITRLAPATDGATPATIRLTLIRRQKKTSSKLLTRTSLPSTFDDVSTDDVADEDIAEIMAGFEQRSEQLDTRRLRVTMRPTTRH